MKKSEEHTRMQDKQAGDILNRLPETHIDWNKSREEAWSELSARLQTETTKGRIITLRRVVRYAVAAAIVILITTSTFMRLYTKTLTVPTGEHKELNLPDGSIVTLNAESEISYRPFWYMLSRKVEMEGEAFFDVMPGRGFTVISEKGTTSVYGTSFNIDTRDNSYEVTCVTGRVKVESAGTTNEVLLKPNQQARILPGGGLEKVSGINANGAISWKNYYFTFTAEPLNRVVEEICRQLDIKITGTGNITLPYTGYFRMDLQPETIMELVFRPFGIDFVAVGDNSFRVITNE